MRRREYRSQYPQEQFIVPLLEARIQALLKRSELRDVKRVLDVGSGGQPLRSAIEQKGWKYSSMDYQHQPGQQTDFIQAIDAPLGAEFNALERFDLLLLTEVLEHVSDWTLAFQNIATLSNPGGFVLLTVPFIYQLHEVPHDYWRPTSFAIREYSKKAGFEVVELEQAGDGWEVLGTVLANLSLYSNAKSLYERLFFRLIRFAFSKLFEAISNGKIRKVAGVHSPLYLSNIALLRRLNA